MAAADGFVELVGRLDYPMLVVTAAGERGRRPSGCLVGFATQCSIKPPRFLVCISKANHTFSLALAAPSVGVHFLGAEQRELAERFGALTGDEVDKLAGLDWAPGPGGAPLMAAVPNRFAGEVLERWDAGDHVAFVVAPQEVTSAADSQPLMYQAVRDVQPGHPA